MPPDFSWHCAGTSAVKIAPYEELHPGNALDIYQTITAQPDCPNYSLEELRLADYNQGRRGQHVDCAALDQSSASRPVTPLFKTVLPTNRKDPRHLKLLRGASIEVCVGRISCPCLSPTLCSCYDSWVLPKSLISRYSPFLRAACTHNFRESDENRIVLPEDDPTVFALFVEWIYYGEYTVLASSLLPGDMNNHLNMNSRCWILGDRLLCTEFKNYVMCHLYTQYAAKDARKTVTTHDVQYACENSAINSKLRQFYFDFVVEHFADPKRLKGTVEEWDELLLDHADVRLALLQNFRIAPNQRQSVEGEMNYMDYVDYMNQDRLLDDIFGKLKLEGNSSQDGNTESG